MTDGAKRWFVLRVYTSQENAVKTYMEQEVKRLGLDHQIGEILIPTETVIEMRDGKKRIKNRVFRRKSPGSPALAPGRGQPYPWPGGGKAGPNNGGYSLPG